MKIPQNNVCDVKAHTIFILSLLLLSSFEHLIHWCILCRKIDIHMHLKARKLVNGDWHSIFDYFCCSLNIQACVSCIVCCVSHMYESLDKFCTVLNKGFSLFNQIDRSLLYNVRNLYFHVGFFCCCCYSLVPIVMVSPYSSWSLFTLLVIKVRKQLPFIRFYLN